MPTSSGNRATRPGNPRAVSTPVDTVILAMPGTLPTTVAGPLDVFTQAGQLWEQLCASNPSPRFRVRIASIDGKEIRCMNGMRLLPDMALADVECADLMIVTSANVAERHTWAGTVAPYLRRLHESGTQVASICTGAFVLAEAGLLRGRVATTHWGFVPVFRQLYPDVDVRPERMLTHDGNIYCSGGINAYAELCLYLVERWCGYRTAEQLARALVLDGWREQQMDYSLFEFQKQHGDKAIVKAQAYMESRLAEPLNVLQLAEAAAMSERNFKRRFKKATGDTPNEYLQRLRIEQAKQQLERTSAGVEIIAETVGYRDVGHFRQIFKQITGVTPNAYREKTRVAPPGNVQAA